MSVGNPDQVRFANIEEVDLYVVKQALARARRRGQRAKAFPSLGQFAIFGGAIWLIGGPLWAHGVNGLVCLWAFYGERKLRAALPREAGVGDTLLEKLRQELTQREKSMEVSWIWDVGPRAVSVGLVFVVYGMMVGFASPYMWSTVLAGFVGWSVAAIGRWQWRRELAMEFAALQRWEAQVGDRK